jgi:hypothetical protein
MSDNSQRRYRIVSDFLLDEAAHGRTPSVEEVARHTGYCEKTARYCSDAFDDIMQSLRDHGWRPPAQEAAND